LRTFNQSTFPISELGSGKDVSNEVVKPAFFALLNKLTEEILEFGAKVAFLKLGNLGAIVHVSEEFSESDFGRAWFFGLEKWQKRVLWAPSYKVEVIGTTGAGDATIAGFLGAILNEMPIEEALSFAMGVGACNVEAIDSVSGVRTWGETAKRINDGWLTNPVSMDPAVWKKVVPHQVWQRKIGI